MAALNTSKRIMASHENFSHLEKENKKKNGGWWHSNYNSLNLIKKSIESLADSKDSNRVRQFSSVRPL